VSDSYNEVRKCANCGAFLDWLWPHSLCEHCMKAQGKAWVL